MKKKNKNVSKTDVTEIKKQVFKHSKQSSNNRTKVRNLKGRKKGTT